MSDRQSFLLSPYRPPTSYPVSLPADEVMAWLNGYAALWHPTALRGAAGPPQPASAYDHDQPAEKALYVMPEGPQLYQPDDWADRLAAVGAAAFRATPNRAETFEQMRTAVGGDTTASPDIVRALAGIGLGYLTLDTLCDAMSHDRLLDAAGFWVDVIAALAAASEAEALTHLTAAAEKLQVAREGMTSGTIRLMDWVRVIGSDDPLPAILSHDRPAVVLTTAETLDKLAGGSPEWLTALRRTNVDVGCGAFRERDDSFLPVESQVWNLIKARSVVATRLGRPPEVFARWRSAFGPASPSWLSHAGYRAAVATIFDGSLAPTRYAGLIHWPAPDGRSIDAVTKEPLKADDPATFFNLAYHLHQSVTHDAAPVLALVHGTKPPADAADDWHALTDLAPVFGTRTTLSALFAEGTSGDYTGASSADEFFADALDRRVTEDKRPDPVSGFARHSRLRKRLDGTFALAALHRSLTPPTGDELSRTTDLERLEDAVETRGPDIGAASEPDELAVQLDAAEADWAKRLADRVQARAADGVPGFLVFNPCGFARRVALEVAGSAGAFPVEGVVKASEFSAGVARAVVEVPPLGYAWLPRPVAGTEAKPRIVTASGTTVRNEFFEAELDAATGGLRAFRDARTRTNRFGQILAFNPGSRMRATAVRVTHAGPAVGEVTSDGELLDEHDNPLATFRQRLRAWVGRPALELRIEIRPVKPPVGYAWHSYYAARFAWRDERAAIFRGVGGVTSQSTYPRPCSPEFVEVRYGSQRSFVFTGGLPFVQKQGGRMADVVLVPEGETETTFDLLLSADRDNPAQVAAGWGTPPVVVPTDKGPPPGGPSGWLGHIDLPSLLLTSFRPAAVECGRAITARFVETAGYGGAAEFRFARNPSSASTADAAGVALSPSVLAEDAVPVEFSAGELFTLRAEWA